MTPWQWPGLVTLSSGSPPCSTDARRRHTPPKSRRATRRALRWRGLTGTHDSARKSNAPVGLPGLGRRTQTGSAVRLKGHVDPYRNEQSDCRKPDQARDEISPATVQLPHPMRYISLPHRWPSLSRQTTNLENPRGSCFADTAQNQARIDPGDILPVERPEPGTTSGRQKGRRRKIVE